MKRDSVLAHQTVTRKRRKDLPGFKRALGQLGFGFIKMFLFLLCLGVLSVGLISGYQFLSSARWFRVQDIVVAGVEDSMREALIELSGITGEDSLLSVDIPAVERTLEEHPWIREVSVTRSFPRTLHIEAHREEPVALVMLDRMCLMDREGVVFKDVEKDDPVDFPIVTGLSRDDEAIKGHLERVGSFLTAYSLWSAVLPARELSEVHVEEDGALSVYFNELPFKVSFGRGDFAKKIVSLQRIIKHLRATRQFRDAKSIDMDYPDRGVVSFADRVT
jgi:cell division protein FtsQ